MSDMHNGAQALTKAEHDELVAKRNGRPLTLTEPIHRKTADDRPAPDLSDDWFGVMPSKAVPTQILEGT